MCCYCCWCCAHFNCILFYYVQFLFYFYHPFKDPFLSFLIYWYWQRGTGRTGEGTKDLSVMGGMRSNRWATGVPHFYYLYWSYFFIYVIKHNVSLFWYLYIKGCYFYYYVQVWQQLLEFMMCHAQSFTVKCMQTSVWLTRNPQHCTRVCLHVCAMSYNPKIHQ